MLYPKTKHRPGVYFGPQSRTFARMLNIFLENEQRRERREAYRRHWSPSYMRQFGTLWLAECRRLDGLPKPKHPNSLI